MTEQHSLQDRVAVVTGASSGIGQASALALARAGAHVMLAARRLDRLEQVRVRIADEGGQAEVVSFDASDQASCRALAATILARHAQVDILINGAGLARGYEPVVDNDERDWQEMMDANLIGLMRVTKAFLPSLIASGRADIVHVSSVAGLQPYARGAAYCASKAAVEAFVQALRFELLGSEVRQLVIQPGMVDTEFSEVRFHGDRARAKAVYAGVTPLSAEDVAECVLFALTRPRHVSIQTLLLMPTAQASASAVARK